MTGEEWLWSLLNRIACPDPEQMTGDDIQVVTITAQTIQADRESQNEACRIEQARREIEAQNWSET